MIFTSYSNIISPLGFSTQENYEAVCASKVGVKQMQLAFSKEVFCVAKIDDKKITQAFSLLANTSDYTKLEQLSIISIQDALSQSGIDPKDKRTLLIYSTTKGNIDILENAYPSVDPKRAYLFTLTKQLQDFFGFVNTP